MPEDGTSTRNFTVLRPSQCSPFWLALSLRKVAQNRSRPTKKNFFVIYSLLAVAMPLGAAYIVFGRAFKDHTVFALEAFEIALFAVFWTTQTVENWDEGSADGVGLVV